MKKASYDFYDLLKIMDRLRAPDGCPWDLEQTTKSLRTYLLEEVYEALDAIDRDDPEALCEELGDSLFEIVFLAKVSEQDGRFDIYEVIDRIAKKMVSRHPHIFDDEVKALENAQEVANHWARAKVAEKKKMSVILQGIPRQLPALLRAYRLGERVSKIGFDWPDSEGVLEKLIEEAQELTSAIQDRDPQSMENEFGDLLFTMVNLGRHLGIPAEESLRAASDRFVDRFNGMEQKLDAQGIDLQTATPDQMEQAWQRSKSDSAK